MTYDTGNLFSYRLILQTMIHHAYTRVEMLPEVSECLHFHEFMTDRFMPLYVVWCP